MNIIFISPNYPAGHWRYVTALREAGHPLRNVDHDTAFLK